MKPLVPKLTRNPIANAWLAGVMAMVFFVILVGVATMIVSAVTGGFGNSVRDQAARHITGSAIGEFASVAVLILFLRQRGRSLRDLGWRRGAPLVGWATAIVVAILTILVAWVGVLHGRVRFADLSAFRIYTSLLAGLTAGICEETVFRGYVMSALAEAGGGRIQQLVATALLFGLAHAPWSHLGGHVNLTVLIGSVINTAVFGLLYGVVVLLSKRSLLPAVIAHGLTDMTIEPWLILSVLGGAT